jgi:hypothetical protein
MEGGDEMQIQNYPDELNYVNAKLSELNDDESFLGRFLWACLHADPENYFVLRAPLNFFMGKYPADVKRLAAEEENSK